MSTVYVAIDGDDVGSQLEYFVIMNNIQELKKFSDNYNNAMSWLSKTIQHRLSAEIIFSGGDNLLLAVEEQFSLIDKLREINAEFSQKGNRTLSIGIGRSPREANVALKLAKVKGKNAVQHYTELTNAEDVVAISH
jgi:c-di-AMP phosphodiesterase-like protein